MEGLMGLRRGMSQLGKWIGRIGRLVRTGFSFSPDWDSFLVGGDWLTFGT